MKKLLSVLMGVFLFCGVTSAENPWEIDQFGNIKQGYGTGYITDIITKGPWFDIRSFMDGIAGRPTYATWYANQATTDVTAVIAAAYAATSQGQTLYLPAGLYRVTSSPGTPAISITKSITLIGDYSGYRDSSDSLSNFGTRIWNVGTGDCLYVHGAGYSAVVKQMALLGNASSLVGLHVVDQVNSLFEDLFVGGHEAGSSYGHGGSGVKIETAGYYTQYNRIHSSYNVGHGFEIAGDVVYTVNAIDLNSIRSVGNGGDGIYMTYCGGVNINSPKIEGNTGYGIHIDSNSIKIFVRGAWYEGNGNSNLVYVNPGYHPSGTGTYVFDGGNYSSGGIHSNVCLDLRVVNVDLAALTLESGTRFADIFGISQSCVVTDNTATGGFPATMIYRNAAAFQVMKLGGTQITTGGAAPASGTWHYGDIAFMNNPTPGQAVGWICTTSGTPGTWMPFYSVIGTPATGNVIKWNAGGYAEWAVP